MILCDQVVVWNAPDGESYDLMEHNSCVSDWIEGDILGSSHRPSEQWVGQHAVDEKSWEVPQPGQLQVDCWQSFLQEEPVVVFNLIVWPCKVFVLLPEVESWNKEDKNCYDEGNEESQNFSANKHTVVILLGIEES